ncbi:MAG TPA: hypothetical protein VEC14_13155 [Reyranellaceae bacterium]|nr:hypothetical protein [Reyranellaceae bacterium]
MSPEARKIVEEAVAQYQAAPHEFSSLRALTRALAVFLEDALESDAPHDFKDNRDGDA